jgi:hypothetical protein
MRGSAFQEQLNGILSITLQWKLSLISGGNFMDNQLLITLSEKERVALEAKAAKSGKELEAVLHEIMARELELPVSEEPTNRPMTSQEFLEKQYREGKILNIATRRQMTPEEEAELERLGRLFADDNKLISDEVIEDRGPY